MKAIYPPIKVAEDCRKGSDVSHSSCAVIALISKNSMIFFH